MRGRRERRSFLMTATGTVSPTHAKKSAWSSSWSSGTQRRKQKRGITRLGPSFHQLVRGHDVTRWKLRAPFYYKNVLVIIICFTSYEHPSSCPPVAMLHTRTLLPSTAKYKRKQGKALFQHGFEEHCGVIPLALSAGCCPTGTVLGHSRCDFSAEVARPFETNSFRGRNRSAAEILTCKRKYTPPV